MKRPPSPASPNNAMKIQRCEETQHSCWSENPSWKQLPKEEEDILSVSSTTSSHDDLDIHNTTYTALLTQSTKNSPTAAATAAASTTTTIKISTNNKEDTPTSNSNSTKEHGTISLHEISSSCSSSSSSDISSSSITPSSSMSTSPLTILESSSALSDDRLASSSSSSSTPPPPTSLYHKTALVFETGKHHYDPHNKYHKERPLRIEAVLDFLSRQDCLIQQQCQYFNTPLPPSSLLSKEVLLEQVHVPGYIQRLQHLSTTTNPQTTTTQERWDQEAQQYKSIYLRQHSYQESLKAATSLCGLVEHVVKKIKCVEENGDSSSSSSSETLLDNGFAIIRPPGHHAEPGFAGGYCILNNIALAATYIQQQKSFGIHKILILDWDIHHGNGTQQMFYDNPHVLVISIHRWHGGHYYPFQKSGGPSHVGTGQGKGRNVNVAWNMKGLGDAEYHYVFQHLVLPMANEFQPDLILVSAGFDAAHGDDIGECHVSPSAFGQFTRACMSIQSKVVCALEGGYKRSVLSCCVEQVVKALLDKDSVEKHTQDYRENFDGRTIHPSAMKSIRATMEAHQPYWKCLQE